MVEYDQVLNLLIDKGCLLTVIDVYRVEPSVVEAGDVPGWAEADRRL